jgi:hypothetical protein
MGIGQNWNKFAPLNNFTGAPLAQTDLRQQRVRLTIGSGANDLRH